jgi:hypothetical protein
VPSRLRAKRIPGRGGSLILCLVRRMSVHAMKIPSQLLAVAGALFLCACSHTFNPKSARIATPNELLSIWRADTTDHVAYMGSDERFHYIFHDQLGGSDSYRVPREQLTLQRTFPLGSGESYVITRDLLQPDSPPHP